MFDYHRSRHLRGVMLAALLSVTWVPRAAIAQNQDPLRTRLEQLQRDERAILDLRAWWSQRARDPELLLLPNGPPSAWHTQPALLNPVTRAQAWEMAQRQAGAWVAMRQGGMPTPQLLMQDSERRSAEVKASIERELLPRFERDLENVRSEFQRLMATRERPEQTPRVAPGGLVWYFRRAVVGADKVEPGYELLDSDANESGGYAQVRGPVQNSGCYETWELRWSFGGQISRLQKGMEVPVTLQAQLTSAPCPSVIQTFIATGGSTMERVIAKEAPSTVLHAGAILESGPRAAANGTDRFVTTSNLLTVGGNPGQSNAWTYFRLQLYMPGQFWVVGYIYLAGGG